MKVLPHSDYKKLAFIEKKNWKTVKNSDVIKVEFGIEFPFFGKKYTAGWLSSEGALILRDIKADEAWSIVPLPSEDAPHPGIFPWWSNLSPGVCKASVDYGSVEYASVKGFLVEFTNVQVADHASAWNTFQVALFEDGKVNVNVKDATSWGIVDTVTGSTVMGAVDHTGTRGVYVPVQGEYSNESWVFVPEPEDAIEPEKKSVGGDAKDVLDMGESKAVKDGVLTLTVSRAALAGAGKIEINIVE